MTLELEIDIKITLIYMKQASYSCKSEQKTNAYKTSLVTYIYYRD